MLRLLQLALTAAGYSALRRKLRASLRSAILIVAASIIGIAGLVFVGGALWLKLSEWYGAFYANLWIGIGLLAVSAIVFLVAYLRRPPPAPASPLDQVLPLMTGVMQQMNDGLKSGSSRGMASTALLAAALLAGVLIGRGGSKS